MTDDMELVRQYAEQKSERAFESLVSRHIDLVYTAAYRHVNNSHQAQEIAQAVFIVLARKAHSLNEKTVLSGWLYRTARFVSADALKRQRRRQIHEQEAHAQSLLVEGQNDSIWEHMTPFLDEAMAQLRDTDRDALVLRFFENKSLREVGAALGLEERTAQKRIHRAVEKLRSYLSKRGVATSAAVLTGVISTNSIQAAPSALTQTISAIAMGKGVAAGGSTLTLAESAIQLLGWTKFKTAIVAVAALIIAAGTTAIAVNHYENVNRAKTNWTAKSLYSVPPLLIVRPTELEISEYFKCEERDRETRFRGRNIPINFVLATAYDFSPHRVVFSGSKPISNFDFLATVSNAQQALQIELQKQLKLTAQPEMRTAKCLLLKVSNKNSSPGLKPAKKHSNIVLLEGHMELASQTLGNLANALENVLEQPVVDKTGINAKFDISLNWPFQEKSVDSINRALREQLGLELVESLEPIKMLVVNNYAN